MTFTLDERDIYFIVSVVLIALQVYQRYVHNKLKNTIDDMNQALGTYIFTTSQIISNLEKKVEVLETKTSK